MSAEQVAMHRAGMRWLILSVVLLCGACTSVADFTATDKCGGKLERQILEHVSCDGAKHAAACAAAGLPSVYGVDDACEDPQRSVRGECLARPHGLEGCTALGDAWCCPL